MLAGALLALPVAIVQVVADDDLAALDWLSWGLMAAGVLVARRHAESNRDWALDHVFEIALVLVTIPAPVVGVAAIRLVYLVRPLLRLGVAGLMRPLLTLRGLRDVVTVIGALVIAAGALLPRIETEQDLTVADGVWWAVGTITTVGYGDVVPETGLGRSLGICVMLLGIATVAMATGAVAEWFVGRLRGEVADRDPAAVDRLTAIERRLGALEERLAPGPERPR